MPELKPITSDLGAAYKLYALRRAVLTARLQENPDFKFDEKDEKALEELLKGDDLVDVKDYVGGDASVRALAVLTKLNELLLDLKGEMATIKPAGAELESANDGAPLSFEEAQRSKQKKRKGKIESPVSIIRRELNSLPDEQIAMLLFRTMIGLKNMQMLLSSDSYEEFKGNTAQSIREQAAQFGEHEEAFLQQFKMFLGEDLMSWPLSEEASELFAIFAEGSDKGIKVDFINGVNSLEENFPASIVNESLKLRSKKEIANWIMQVGELNQLLFNASEKPLPDDLAKLIDSFVREPMFNFNKDFMSEEAQDRFKIQLVRTLKKGLNKFEPIVENLLLKDTGTTKKSISHLMGMDVDKLIVESTSVELAKMLGPMAPLVLPFILSINEYIQTKTHEIVQEEISEEVRAQLVEDFKIFSTAAEPTNLEECTDYLYKCKGFIEEFNEVLLPVLDEENLIPKLLAKIAEEPFFKQLAPLLEGGNAEELVRALVGSLAGKANIGNALSSVGGLLGMVPSGEDEVSEDDSQRALVGDNRTPGLRLFKADDEKKVGDVAEHSAKEVTQLLEPLVGAGDNPFAQLVFKYINHPQWLSVDIAYDIAKNVRDKYDEVFSDDIKNLNEAVKASTLLGLQLLKEHATANSLNGLLREVNSFLPKETKETKRPEAKRQEHEEPILQPPVEERFAVDRSNPLKNSNMWKLIVGGVGAALTAIGFFTVKDKFKTALYSIGTLAVGSVIGSAMNTGTKVFSSTKTWIVGLGGLALTAIGYLINGEKFKSSMAGLGTLGVGTLGGFTDLVSNFLTSSKDGGNDGNRERSAFSEGESNPLGKLFSMATNILEEAGVQLGLPQPEER